MQRSSSIKQQAVVGSLSLMLLLSFMLLTNPRNMSAIFLLLMPLLIYISTYSVAKVLGHLLFNVQRTRMKVIAAAIAAGPTLVVTLGSLGQLGFQDVLLAFLLCFGFAWYFRRFQAAEGSEVP